MPAITPPLPISSLPPVAMQEADMPSFVPQTPLNAQHQKANDYRAAQSLSQQPKISSLAGWVRQRWDEAKRAKLPHEMAMIKDLRQRNGEYDPEDLAVIRQSGGSEIYMMLTAAKCRAAEAWIKSIMLPADRSPIFAIKPTELPSLPDDVQKSVDQALFEYKNHLLTEAAGGVPPMMFGPEDLQAVERHVDEIRDALEEYRIKQIQEEADERAQGMFHKMQDQLQEGGFYQALAECISDLTTFPACFMKGPIPRMESKLSWERGNQYAPKVETKATMQFDRVSPFDIYPLTSTVDIQTGGFFHRHKGMGVDEIYAMIGVDGFNEQSIRAAIDQYGESGFHDWLSNDTLRATAEGRINEFLVPGRTIDVLEFWGKVPGTLLLDFGMDETDIPDRSNAYEVNLWVIGQYVVKAALNPNPLGKRPYGMATYEHAPGWFWGKGLSRLIRDSQRMCNAMGRNVANNAAIASGPQVGIDDIDRLPDGEDGTDIFPWKVWQFKADVRGSNRPPIYFFQPNLIAQQLLEVYTYFYKLADDMSGVQAAASYGADRGEGATSTASGQAMLRQDSNRLMGDVVNRIDRELIEPVLQNLYVYNMLFDDNENIKGDAQIEAIGSSQIMVRETAQMRRTEFLNATNNPADLQIMGLDGRAKVLRESVKTLQMDDTIIPKDDELLNRLAQSAQWRQQEAQAAALSKPQATPNARDIAQREPIDHQRPPASLMQGGH